MAEATTSDGPERVPRTGVLVKADIVREKLIELPEGESGAEPLCYQPASYDLRLGYEYIVPGEEEVGLAQAKIRDCRDEGGVIVIPPFSSMIVSTYEIIKLPPNIIGRFNLRIKQAFRGLIVQIGTQVEPKYRGRLFALLQNITDQHVAIKYRDYETRPFTIEFYYTTAETTHPARQPILGLGQFVRDVKLSATLSEILKEQDELNKKVDAEIKDVGPRSLTFYGIILSLVIAVLITGIVTIVAPVVLKVFFDIWPLGGAKAVSTSEMAKNIADAAKTTAEAAREQNERLKTSFEEQKTRLEELQTKGASAGVATNEAIKQAAVEAASLRDDNERLKRRLDQTETRAAAADASLNDAVKRITELEQKASAPTPPVVAPLPTPERKRPRRDRRKVRR